MTPASQLLLKNQRPPLLDAEEGAFSVALDTEFTFSLGSGFRARGELVSPVRRAHLLRLLCERLEGVVRWSGEFTSGAGGGTQVSVAAHSRIVALVAGQQAHEYGVGIGMLDVEARRLAVAAQALGARHDLGEALVGDIPAPLLKYSTAMQRIATLAQWWCDQLWVPLEYAIRFKKELAEIVSRVDRSAAFWERLLFFHGSYSIPAPVDLIDVDPFVAAMRGSPVRGLYGLADGTAGWEPLDVSRVRVNADRRIITYAGACPFAALDGAPLV